MSNEPVSEDSEESTDEPKARAKGSGSEFDSSSESSESPPKKTHSRPYPHFSKQSHAIGRHKSAAQTSSFVIPRVIITKSGKAAPKKSEADMACLIEKISSL